MKPHVYQFRGQRSLLITPFILIPLIIFGIIWGVMKPQTARATAELTVSIDTAYNLVVDSNVTSPSTYAPRVATVYGTFCNDGDTSLSNVYGYIGNYDGGNNPTPGLYPARNSADVNFSNEYPWAANTGNYAFTHIGGTADASRHIGDLDPGECKVQYWHFTYPACANTAAGAAVAPPCSTTPSWGDSVKPEDDLWLEFDVWATGIDTGSDTPRNDNARWRMTLRNEISAMANKIKPNPDGRWFNTDTSIIVPGQVITTNGILYTLGNVRQGFDNDENFTPDYNAWLQPFGDPSYDPSCFRLIRTSTVLTVSRSAGQPDLILNVDDLNPHPTYGGPLYFTNLPPDNNGVDGEVRYTFLALNGPCSVPISPYQEVASGSDNEKFNGDYGTGIPTIQSSAPEVTISKTGPDTVGENVQFTYSIPFENTSDTYSAGLTLNSGGVNMPLVIREEVPDGLQYEASSAATGNTNPTDCTSDCYTIRYSTDSGATWSTTDPGNPISTHPDNIVKIEWWLTNPLPTNGTGVVTFQARVPTGYIAGGGDPFIVNEACANFGAGTDFACATDVTMVTGNNSVGDYVWADDNANGLQDGGETGIADITVWLYWDVNGDGLLDDGDLLIAEDVTDVNGTYGFADLPDGNYLVVVDSEDGDLPTGYSNTTPAVHAVTGLGTTLPDTYLYADFGFGPVLSLEKTLTSGNPAYEGQLVTFDLDLTNNLPGDGTGQAISCQHYLWAQTVNGTAGTPPSNAEGTPSSWANQTQIRFAPDGVPALAGFAQNGTTNIGLSEFTVGQQTGDIQSVRLIAYVSRTTAASNSSVVATLWFNNAATTEVVTYDSSRLVAGDTVYVFEDLITYEPVGGWNWSHFGIPSGADPGGLVELALQGNRGTGSPTGKEYYVDAIGFLIETTSGCGGTDSTVDPLPLTDSYDADKLEFVSATPTESATGTAVTPYANTGTISWDNLGPLHAGGTKTVQVTFRVLEPAGNAATDTINYAAVNGATFSNGRPTNQPTAQAPVDIEPTGSIGDTIWNDLDGNGSQNGEPGLAGVLVSLTASTDVTINGVTYTAGDVIMTAVTDANGEYLFEGLPDATYTVTVDDTSLPGMTPTYDADGQVGTPHQSTTTISGANDNLAQDFGYTIPIIIYGNVWQDFDGDGTEDADDAPIANVDVTLYWWDGGSWQAIGTEQTDTDGNYLFDAIAYPAIGTGDYYVATDPTSLPVGPIWDNTYDPDSNFDDESGTIVVAAGEMSGSHDFGYHQTGPHSISGNVYADWNSNADFEGNDTGFGGISVTLYSDTGAVIATTTTAADGSYTFPNLPNGTYTVIVDESSLPPQYSQTEDWDELPGACTICDGSASVTINGGDESGIDFGYEPAGYGTIGDFVWQDNNGDGYQQAGEPGLPNVTVNLYVDYGDGDGYVLVATTVTDADGLYSFGNLPPGNYSVEVDTADPDLPTDGYGNPMVTTTPTTVDVTLVSGQTYLDADFGFAPGGVIGDTIYWDANGNAEQDWNEYGIPDVDVTLQVWNGSAWVYYDDTTTDSEGNYLFTGLPAGEYRVVVDTSSTPIAGRTLTGDPDTNGLSCVYLAGLPNTDPDYFFLQFCDSIQEVEIRPGQTYLGADFGYQPTGVIGDFVWLDGNGDGVQDAGEPGLADVTVYLCNTTPCASGNAIETTTTDYEGYYSFINVGDGTWYVAVDESTLPAGLAPTYDLDGGTTNPNSETEVVLAAGDSNLNADFGYRLNGTYQLSGTVYYDLDESGGDQGIDEPGYEGQTVYLWQLVGSSYVQVGSTTTDTDGNYSFTNLPAGNYVVSTNATSPILNNAAHTSTPTQNDDTAWEAVEIVDQNIADVDFGFFIPTDFDDLPDSYNTTLSGGAYHTNSGDSGTLRLGTGIDLEPNGLPGTTADGDSFDDGVTRDMADSWIPGATVQLNITVSGGDGVVGGWFDWNNDGEFTADEFVNYGTLSAGTHTVNVTIPAGYTTGQDVYARFRVFEPANVSGGTLTADDYNGGATGGEVEGYLWEFGPTAVSLHSFSANQQTPMLLSMASILAMLLLSATAVWRQRPTACAN